jgi:hypothetical protein
MLLDIGIHMIPRLRADGEDVHRRSIDRWIVQTSCLQSKNIGQPFQFHCHLVTAIRTKPAFDCLTALSDNLVITRLTADLSGSLRHHNDRGVSADACLLAVPTMTVQHKDWIGTAIVMDRATGASA